MSTSELVFRCDDDDPDTYNYLTERRQHVFFGPRYDGYRSMSTFFNDLWQKATGDVFMCGNDDMVFRTSGWDRLILERANDFPDGLFDIGVSTFNEDHFPFSTVSRRVVERLGFLWDPTIFWGDIFLRDVMGAFGRAVRLPSVRIDHEWMGHDAHPDDTFLEANQQDIFARDPTYWSGTHAKAVSRAVVCLQELEAVA